MIAVIDNYDSFTYNLVQYVGELTGGDGIKVYRNDAVSLSEIDKLSPQGIIISPGPGNPDGAGLSMDIVRKFYKRIPILGVCLGHQVIAQVFGGKIIRARQLMHGKISLVNHCCSGLFDGIKNPFPAVRYHSLAVDESSFPAELEMSASADDGEIMALRHKEYPVWGLQFHPESILTENGKMLVANFLKGVNK